LARKTFSNVHRILPAILNFFFGVPHLATCIFLIFYNGPELGAEIDPGMALTPLPSSIGRGSNPQPSDREPSALPLDHSFCYLAAILGRHRKIIACLHIK